MLIATKIVCGVNLEVIIPQIRKKSFNDHTDNSLKGSNNIITMQLFNVIPWSFLKFHGEFQLSDLPLKKVLLY